LTTGVSLSMDFEAVSASSTGAPNTKELRPDEIQLE